MRAQTVHLGYKPRAWQDRCHRDRKRFTVLALHRRAGKTKLAIAELVDKALRSSADRAQFVYLAPQLNQARSIAWRELKAMVEPLRRVGAVDVRESDLTIAFIGNGAQIRLFGADNPDALRGLRLDGIVIDEVAQIVPELWQDVVRPALADRLGWAIFIGTPNGTNLFSELFFGASGKPDWHAARWTVYETGALPESEVAKLRAEMPDNSFAREFLCDFAASAEDQLIALQDVEDAARRGYSDAEVNQSARVLGVDPARFGDDRSVIFPRQGLVALSPIVLRGVDNMALASRVANEIERWQADAVFVDSGAGAGVIDRLRQLGHSVVEVPFGGKALRPEFVNRRTEMWCAMADWVRNGGAIPRVPQELRTEMATPTYWFDAQGRKVLESKDDIKKRLQGAGSPDLADALALTFAAPVHPRSMQQAPTRRRAADYDPLDAIRGQ